MVSTIEHTQPGRTKLALGVALIAIAHVAYIFATYRARAVTHAALWSSDTVVFALPTLLAFFGFIGLLHGRRTSWLVATIVSVVLTFISLWIGLLITFNTYGT